MFYMNTYGADGSEGVVEPMMDRDIKFEFCLDSIDVRRGFSALLPFKIHIPTDSLEFEEVYGKDKYDLIYDLCLELQERIKPSTFRTNHQQASCQSGIEYIKSIDIGEELYFFFLCDGAVATNGLMEAFKIMKDFYKELIGAFRETGVMACEGRIKLEVSPSEEYSIV